MTTLAVMLLTYQRTGYALRTICAARRFLRYSGRLVWYIADDGSEGGHFAAVRDQLALEGYEPVGWHTVKRGYGGNVNAAYDVVQREADLTLFLEDDWELQAELDLDPYARLLLEREDIGMVRLGYLNLNMRGTCIGHGGHLYWQLERDADPYVCTGHPSLRHRRFWQAYGAYPAGLNPGETELAYALQFRTGSGPGIVYPAALGEYGPFGHIGADKSY